MKANTIESIINKSLHQMFDSFYEISVFTALPGDVNQEEVFRTRKGIELRLKHIATYAALHTALYGNWDYKNHLVSAMKELVVSINRSGKKTICSLDEAYTTLIEKMVQLN